MKRKSDHQFGNAVNCTYTCKCKGIQIQHLDARSNYAHFLNAVFALESFASFNLLLAVVEVLRQ